MVFNEGQFCPLGTKVSHLAVFGGMTGCRVGGGVLLASGGERPGLLLWASPKCIRQSLYHTELSAQNVSGAKMGRLI